MDFEPSEKKNESASIEAETREEEPLIEEQVNPQPQNTQQSQDNVRPDQTESIIDANSNSQGIYR